MFKKVLFKHSYAHLFRCYRVYGLQCLKIFTNWPFTKNSAHHSFNKWLSQGSVRTQSTVGTSAEGIYIRNWPSRCCTQKNIWRLTCKKVTPRDRLLTTGSSYYLCDLGSKRKVWVIRTYKFETKVPWNQSSVLCGRALAGPDITKGQGVMGLVLRLSKV